MSYPIEIRLASKNGYHTPAEAKAYYGRYDRAGVTVHWWNSPDRVKDSDHDNIVNYMLGKAARGVGSVNYVLSNKKITLVVNPDNVAWASQAGNPTTVSIEFSPHLNAEGYKKAGWLLNELFNPQNGRYRIPLRLWKHSDWNQTACPGTLDLARMKNEAAKWARGGYNPAPEPTPPPATKPLIDEWTLWKETEQLYVTNKQPTFLYDLKGVKSWGDIKQVKSFNKGEKVAIAGSFRNTALNRVYYVTRYSFDRKIANGFNPVDLEIYVPPRPVPEPPEEPVEPTDPDIEEPTDPTPPIDPPEPAYPNWFVKFWVDLWEAIKNILGIKG